VAIRYELDRSAEVKRFSLADPAIAPLGTFTDDWEWRYTLKPGDELDCLDDEKDWYKSTVIGQRTRRNAQGEEIPEIYVAFRTYEPEGSKQD
jgi:hypothetical protein